jgi:ParB/RepB/Spo0J family partition protein
MRQQMIPISAIFPRTEGLLRRIKPEYVKLLVESVREIGLQTPISVRVIPCEPGTPFRHNGNTYEVAAGNHRLEACKQLGWDQVPAFLLELSDPYAWPCATFSRAFPSASALSLRILSSNSAAKAMNCLATLWPGSA